MQCNGECMVCMRVSLCVCIQAFVAVCAYAFIVPQLPLPSFPFPSSLQAHACTQTCAQTCLGVCAHSPVEANSWRVCGRPSSWPIQEHGKRTVRVACMLHLERMHAARMHHDLYAARPASQSGADFDDTRQAVPCARPPVSMQHFDNKHAATCNIEPS